MEVKGFNENGLISVVIDGTEWAVPDDLANIYRQTIDAWEFERTYDEDGNLVEEKRVNTIPPYVPASLPYSIYKTTLWLRLTDAEAETVMAAKNQQPAKFRGIWDDALTIQSDSQFFGTLKAFLAAALSPARAVEILQPES